MCLLTFLPDLAAASVRVCCWWVGGPTRIPRRPSISIPPPSLSLSAMFAGEVDGMPIAQKRFVISYRSEPRLSGVEYPRKECRANACSHLSSAQVLLFLFFLFSPSLLVP